EVGLNAIVGVSEAGGINIASGIGSNASTDIPPPDRASRREIIVHQRPGASSVAARQDDSARDGVSGDARSEKRFRWCDRQPKVFIVVRAGIQIIEHERAAAGRRWWGRGRFGGGRSERQERNREEYRHRGAADMRRRMEVLDGFISPPR